MTAADSFVGEHLVPSPWKECMAELEDYKKRNDILDTLLKNQRKITAEQATETMDLTTQLRQLEIRYRQECEVSADLQAKIEELRQANTASGVRYAVNEWRTHAQTLRELLADRIGIHRADIMTIKANDRLNLKLLEEGSIDEVKSYLTTNVGFWTTLLDDMNEEIEHPERYLPDAPVEP